METRFEKIKKRYALNNSYFKNKRPQDPSNPIECFYYVEQHGELPYNSELEDCWLEECFAEFQKRNTEYKMLEQFFTPSDTAKRMNELLDEYGNKDCVYALDVCCGYGALSKNSPFIIKGLDIDNSLCELYENYTGNKATCMDFMEYNGKEKNIISNPPYSIKTLTAFLEKLYNILEDDGIAVLLLPKGFIDKERPKATVEALEKFGVGHREDMREEFASTKMTAEIVVIKKL